MSNFSMKERVLQEEICGDERLYVDESTGEIVEWLRDRKFAWRERKKATLRLADAYRVAKMDKQAERAKTCATWLEYLATSDGDVRQLHGVNTCHLRLCPLCGARRAHVTAHRLTRILLRTYAEHPHTQLLFLTLTVRSVSAEDLRSALDQLTRAWFKLVRRRPVARAIGGWYRAIEITRNRKCDTYHPHIHAILVVEDEYFSRKSGLYLSQERWRDMWQQSLRCDYRPMVRIQRTHGKSADAGAADAALEAAKYACKDSDYIGEGMPLEESARVVQTLTVALERKRMTALGGWMLDASRALELDMDDTADVDLVHGDDSAGELTEQTAEMMEHYGWHFGVQNHILTNRFPNPNYQKEDLERTVK